MNIASFFLITGFAFAGLSNLPVAGAADDFTCEYLHRLTKSGGVDTHCNTWNCSDGVEAHACELGQYSDDIGQYTTCVCDDAIWPPQSGFCQTRFYLGGIGFRCHDVSCTDQCSKTDPQDAWERICACQ